MFVCASREIARDFYRQLKAIRPARFEVKQAPDGVVLTEQEQKRVTAFRNGEDGHDAR